MAELTVPIVVDWDGIKDHIKDYLPHWIPCSERLPEEEKTVLAWGKKHQCILFDWMHDNKWCFGDEDYWMPLPEPPTIIESGVSES